ncbi:MAG: hypothetical protein DRI32_06020 [Chloroflexi bacterium]|nr:MAG: hypothetical protein DRI32_06020 [Chloroflexota bacterium]
MAENFHDFIEKVRDANPIEDVIQEDGYPLKGYKTMMGMREDCNSLTVRTDWGKVWWYSKEPQYIGDVFAWVQREKGCDFMEAVEYLAKRAGYQMPKFSEVNEGERVKNLATADAFTVAADVFNRWLFQDEAALAYMRGGMWSEDEALAYVKKNRLPAAVAEKYADGRAFIDEILAGNVTAKEIMAKDSPYQFSDETLAKAEKALKEGKDDLIIVRGALMGFSGRNTAAQKKEMVDVFLKQGVDRFSPAAMAVTGFKGDIKAWAERRKLLDDPEFDKGWIAKGFIHGLMGNPGIIYAHQKPVGKVEFLSRRNMPGFCGSDGKWKSFNPQKGLVGEKKFYYNHLYRQGAPLVMVEGQGDAVTWGQWGYAALAFCGVVGSVESMTEERRERLEREIAKLKKYHPVLYYAADNDETGVKAIHKMGKLFGPMLKIVRYPTFEIGMDAVSTSDEDENIEENNDESN